MAYTLFSIQSKTNFNWLFLSSFLKRRLIEHCETVNENTFNKIVRLEGNHYFLTFRYCDERGISVSCTNELTTDIQQKIKIRVERMFDISADIKRIDTYLSGKLDAKIAMASIRIPGCFSIYEATVRTILAQQVSVKRATKLVSLFTSFFVNKDNVFAFPEKEEALSKIEHVSKVLPITRYQKNALIEFTQLLNQHIDIEQNIEDILKIKGVGLWTMNLIRLRGFLDKNIWLAGDLVIKKVCQSLAMPATSDDDYLTFTPWRSYLTLTLWHHYNLINNVYYKE